jgi:hypothetical protein
MSSPMGNIIDKIDANPSWLLGLSQDLQSLRLNGKLVR